MTTSQEAQQEADCRLTYLDRVYRKTPHTTQLDRKGNYTETFSSHLYTISHSSSWFNSFPPDILEVSRLKAAQLLATSGTVSVLCNVIVQELESQWYVGYELKLGQEEELCQEEDVGQEETVGQEDEGREVDVELEEDECQDEEESPEENLELEEDECQDEEESQEEDPVECHVNVLDNAMTSLVNFTDVSAAVRDAVRDDVSFLPSLLGKLHHWSQPHLHGELQCLLEDRLVECGLAILSNLASRGDNLSRLRDLHTLDIILPFIHSPSNRVRLLALCAVMDVATDSELQLLTFPADIADLVRQHLTCALASSTRRWDGFGVSDLLRPLKKLAQHNSTSRLLADQGVLSLLTQCIKETEEQMQADKTTENQMEAVSTGQSQMQVTTTIQNQVQPVSTGPNQLQAATDYWRSCILSYFPKLHQQTYFVPPVHFSRKAFAVEIIGDQMVYIPQSPTDQLSAQGSVQSSSSTASVASSSCLPSITSQNAASSSHSTNVATVSAPGPSSVAAVALSTPVTPLFLSSGHQNLQHPHQHHSQTPQHMSVQPVAGYVWAARPSDPTPPTAQVQDSESRDDHAQQHVLHCLRGLSQSLAQAMLVVSQLQFGDYLNKPCYAPAAAKLPRPLTLATKLRRGDFDILIIHSQHGLMVGEIKSVGANMADLNLTPEKQEAVLRKKLVQAVSQLDKAETVLRHVVSDLVTALTIRKTVMLPHITSGQLLQVLKDSSPDGQALARAFRACLGATTDEEAVSYSLCADQLSSSHAPWDVTPHVLDQLTAWWRLRVAQFGQDPTMTPSVYEHLVARFCGPATTVRVWCPVPPRLGPRELRTEGEGVAETGERVAQLTLTPGQVDLLTQAPPLVFLTGPPGTGKTVVLTLMATEWLRQGHVVNVLGTHLQSRATTYLIERQLLHVLNATRPGHSHMVRRLQYDFLNLDRDEKKEAVDDLLKVMQDGQLHVIADDINGMENFDDFCQQLVPRVPKLRLWAADTLAEVTPHGLDQLQLTAPLRCPPVVVREILLSRFFADGSIEAFSDSGTAAPTDGPCIKHLQHRHQPGHARGRPEDCCTCGQLVAAVLQDLHVGGMGLDISSKVNTNTSSSSDAYPTPLMFRDVLILCENPREERRKAESGALELPAVTLARVLREKGAAVQVVETEDEAAVRELALATRDEVAVVAWETAHGLERRVVVVMVVEEAGINSSRLYCVSRCTAQLILIDFDLNDDEKEEDNETYTEPCDDNEVVSEEDGQSDECCDDCVTPVSPREDDS